MTTDDSAPEGLTIEFSGLFGGAPAKSRRTVPPAAELILYGGGGSTSVPLRAYETDLAKIGGEPAPGSIAVQRKGARGGVWRVHTFPKEPVEYATVVAAGVTVWDSRGATEDTTEPVAPEPVEPPAAAVTSGASAEDDIELQRREQAAAAASRAGLQLVACGQRDSQCTYNLVDSHGKRKRRVHVALTLDEVLDVLEPAGPETTADDVDVDEPVIDVDDGAAPAADGAEHPYQVMPPLSDEDAEQLRESIRARGVLMPIVVDENDVILDGHHRARIAAELGIECPREVRRGLTETEKRSLAYELNSARRQLTREQKRDLVVKSLKADPQLSDREHGRRGGVDHKTVAKVRGEMEGRGDIPHVDTRTDSAGREQPASKPAASPEPVDVDVLEGGALRGASPSKEPEPAAAAAPIEAAEPAEEDPAVGEDVLDGDEQHEDTEPIAEPADAAPAEPEPEPESAGDEPLMKYWTFEYRDDGTAEISVEFCDDLDHWECDDRDDHWDCDHHEFYDYDPRRGDRAWRASFGDQAIPASVAAELADRIKAAIPEIIKLGVALGRRGREGGK